MRDMRERARIQQMSDSCFEFTDDDDDDGKLRAFVCINRGAVPFKGLRMQGHRSPPAAVP